MALSSPKHMRFQLIVPTLLTAATAAVAQTPARTVSTAVYTQAQADRGKAAYTEQCAACHGAALTGGDETPALTGDKFLAKWRGQPVDEMFEKVRATMPPGKPNSLSREKEADILAYIFSVNKFPAGNREFASGG